VGVGMVCRVSENHCRELSRHCSLRKKKGIEKRRR
jgi:hypothetical protein